MTHRVSRIPLMAMSPGTSRSLMVHRFGAPGARPKAYLQAAIHADEIPGILVLQHLIARLIDADRSGAIGGEIIVAPFANPIGLGQRFRGDLLGRYEFRAGGNFNRGFPHLDEAIGDRVEGHLTGDAAHNVAVIRAAFMAEVEALPANNELQQWRREFGFDGPTYADLHSLFLGKDESGHRVPRTLEAWATWLRCFDAVQMNEDEFDLLGGADDPWQRAAGALGPQLKLITVTMGVRGAAYVSESGFCSDPLEWPGVGSRGARCEMAKEPTTSPLHEKIGTDQHAWIPNWTAIDLKGSQRGSVDVSVTNTGRRS